MSLKPQNFYVVPEDTAKIAQAIFPDGNLYLCIYDTFGTLFQDDDITALFPQDGQPAEALFRLMLVLILQFLENLTDRQAADAARTTIDWKYLLCLRLTDAGFHYSVLSEFRTRLIQGKADQVLFEKLLNVFREKDVLKGHRQQRADSTGKVFQDYEICMQSDEFKSGFMGVMGQVIGKQNDEHIQILRPFQCNIENAGFEPVDNQQDENLKWCSIGDLMKIDQLWYIQ